jgi:D,D-heptose 1,7-bisphosphate phosphatase
VDKAVFLDRDGVINVLDMGSYVTSWDKFIFLEGVIEAIVELNRAGYLVIIITNQSAINRGLMTEEDLKEIHSKMLAEIENAGGHVEGIYHCPHAPDENCGCRKPNTGMFDKVNQDYEIDYANSWFVGDFESKEAVGQILEFKD